MPRPAPAVRPRSTAQPAPARAPGPDPLRHEVEGLVYALDALPRRQGRRAVLTVRLASPDPGPPLVDRCDLYAFRSRQAFAQLVADVFGRDPGAVLGHLALVLDAVERTRASEEGEARAEEERLTPERRARAEALLAQPDLLARAGAAMTALGHVGEPGLQRLCFLIALSRLFPHPLSALLLAPPGAGKSAVLDAVSALVPPEHQVSLARLTQHSLFYAGPGALRHRLLLVDEYAGQEEAEHAVRVLQSKGQLTLSVTIKGRAEELTAQGPVAVMSGTTTAAIDPQNASRALLLGLDDSPAQTRRIQAAQAEAWADPEPARDQAAELGPWHDAQRLLAEDLPARVKIPFAARIELPARTTADRRLGPQLFGLVAAHALLHARTRPRGRERQIVASSADYAAVHALLQPLLAEGPDGLSPRAARAHAWLVARGRACDRRELAQALGWSYNTAKKALMELMDHELLRRVEAGPPARYLPIGPRALAPLALTPPRALA